MDKQPEVYLTLAQMAERLQITTATLKKYVRKYNIPCIAIGRLLRFNPERVEKHLEKALETPKIIFPARKGKSSLKPNIKNPDTAFFRRELGLE